jgi:ferredoxin-type protein NapH
MVAMTKGESASWTARLARWRLWVQAAFLLAWLDPLLLRLHTVCAPVFHCYSCPLATFACPIGVLANFSAIHLFPFVAIGTLLAVGALLGSFVCGWVCPFGLLQDLVGRIPTRKYELPGWMGHFRYVTLAALVLAVPYWYGEDHPLFFCRLCPAGALEAALPNTVRLAVSGAGIVWPSPAKSIIFVVIAAAMLFTWRPWCTLFCPLGAIYSLCNRFSFFFLRFHPDRCNDCDLCRSLCRYHGRGRRRSSQMQCVRCLDCTRCDALVLTSVLGPSGKSQGPADLLTITQDGQAE